MSAATSLVWLKVSKAFDRSNAITSVRIRMEEIRGFLKPGATLCTRGNRAEVVDNCLQKPCWVSERLKFSLRNGRSMRWRPLMVGQRSETGR